jgi:hypothetical protein
MQAGKEIYQVIHQWRPGAGLNEKGACPRHLQGDLRLVQWQEDAHPLPSTPGHLRQLLQ